MSITDELREYAHDCCAMVDDAIHAIADRIDAEHQKALDEWKAKHGQMWLKGYSECHAELLEGNETLASDLERCGWILLPKDADGVPIRIGDVMEWCDNGETLTVEGVGNDVLFYIDGENAEWTAARNKRHHHAPTVEDVLREFAVEVCGEPALTIRSGVVEEYASRLRLAGES